MTGTAVGSSENRWGGYLVEGLRLNGGGRRFRGRELGCGVPPPVKQQEMVSTHACWRAFSFHAPTRGVQSSGEGLPFRGRTSGYGVLTISQG